MKALNILLKVNLAAVIIAAFTFGCDSVTNPDPVNTIDSTRTATITGTAIADDGATPEIETAPAGTKIIVMVNSYYYMNRPVGGLGDYQMLRYETELNDAGEYSVEVPALNKATTVDIQVVGEGFTANGTTFDQTGLILNTQVYEGLSYNQDITY